MAPKEGMKRFLLLGSPLGYPLSIPTQNLDGAKTVPFRMEKKHFYAFGNRDFILSHQPQMHAPFFCWEILQIFPSNICLNLDFSLHFFDGKSRELWFALGLGDSRVEGFVWSPKTGSMFFFATTIRWCSTLVVWIFLIHQFELDKKMSAKEDFGFINQPSKLENKAFSRLFVDGMILLIRFRNPARKPQLGRVKSL